ncbi:hypothetical protein F4780DRAFT_538321 [Xylariomycetidae sp. FL0641]|nr:hypothetical protein F4780DRAFT_538321 [Xylariomycetidae sp. FL0641]
MQSADSDGRSQRRRPDLNINTSPAAINRPRDTRPSTPPGRRPPVPNKSYPPVSSQVLKKPSSASTNGSTRNSEGSFLENDSPVDPDTTPPENPRGRPRDSHDLSLSPRQFTRDSFVTNMLSSLDQFSLAQINTPISDIFEGDDRFGIPRDGYSKSMTNVPRPMYSAGTGQAHGHTHSYSYSSDYDITDDAASRISSQFSRGRRSNSSSGFQSSLGRINSMRDRSHPGNSGMRALHSRGGRASKSSSTNSIDTGGYAQVLTTQRWAHGIGGRSSSLDYGQRPSLNSPSAWKKEFTNTFLVDDYEAAPTPTIPGGPRRPGLPTAAAAPPPTASDSIPKTPERKRNTRSRSGTDKTPQSKHSNTREGPIADEIPPLPTFDIDSAPAPNVGYGKSKEAGPSAPVSAPPVKERPGFFSRLFGSSRTTPTADPSPTPIVASPPADQPENKSQHIASQIIPQSAPPSRDAPHSSQQPHVVQKKSSFFRRRKKSVAEPPMPPLPVPPQNDLLKAKDDSISVPFPSPVSSLRQVMSPYLKDSATSTPTGPTPQRRETPSRTQDIESQDENSGRRGRGFSPDYEPSPNATIRTVKSTSALKNRESLGPDSRWRRQMDSPMRSPPEVPPKSTKRNDTTFFNDSSDEGERNDRSHPSSRPRMPRHHKTDPSSGLAKKASHKDFSEDRATRDSPMSRSEASPSLVLQRHASAGAERSPANLGLPMDSRRGSGASRPALSRSVSSVPSVHVDEPEASSKGGSPLDEPEVAVGEPTEYDRQKAQQIFDGNEDFIQKEKAAAWMGEEGLVRQRTLTAYMDLYDFEKHSVLSALRQVCNRLVFRAETQQVDRILVAFSKRWCDCNPNHGFKSIDVIHTMCYSIMLLNTDLHLADIEHKMTRSQFVKNTMSTVKQALADSAPEVFNRTSILPGNSLLSPAESEMTIEPEPERSNWRSSFKPAPRSESATGHHGDSGTPVEGCGPLVTAPFDGSFRAWEGQMEIVLKDIYVSIRDEKLPLFGADPNHQPQQQSGGLSVMGMLRRTPSVLSKAPSEGQASARGRIRDPNRNNGGRWSSKSRSRPRFAANGFSSSRTSFDDSNSLWSPTVSSATWSRYSLGRTQTSMSMDSFGSGYQGDYQQSIGFANALSQAIIREDGPPGTSGQSIMSDEISATQLLEDDSLELLGPPWMKEGNVIHKHHLDGVDKKAKERNWSEVFAVVQKGTMSLFSFSTKSMRQKARAGRKHAAGAVVGGGNWQENATCVGSYSLRQTLASALPPPGYSRTRPHVWALSLPSGAVHLFQVGTPEISKEFVLTVNYWSARLSTHPLIGGISNIEYGWSDNIINNALVTAINDTGTLPPRPGSAAAGRASMHSRQGSRQSSIRSSFDVGSSNRPKLPGDRVQISEWAPPAQSMRPSNCSEAEQLETLLAYVKSIEDDLQQHNQFRSPMLLAFTPRGHNSAKALANWERKSSYLLREIVKYRTYVDCLQHASTRRAEVNAERETARRAARGEDISDDDAASHYSLDADTTLQAA